MIHQILNKFYLYSNDMKSLVLDPTPIASILELVNTTTFNTDLIFAEVNELKQFILPKFKPGQIQTLRDAKDDIVSITEFFTITELKFKLNNEEIKLLVNIINQTLNAEISKYASCVILVGFLTFVHRIFFREPIQYLICDAILHIDQGYIEIALSSFFFAFKIIAKHKIDTITPEFIQSITYFYIFDYQYPEETVEVLYQLMSNVYKVKSTNIPSLLQVVCQVSQCQNIILSSNLIDKFLNLFQPNFLDLKVDYVITFSHLLNKATPNEFKSTFIELPQHIINGLQQNSSPLPLPSTDTSSENHSIIINDQTVLSSSYFTPKFDFFKEPFDRSLLKKVPEVQPINNQVIQVLDHLFNSITFLKQYSNDFLNSLVTFITSKNFFIFELIDIFFKCAKSASKMINLSLDFDQISTFSYINDPQLTLFNSNCNPLFFVRKEMVGFFLVSQQPNFFKQFIQKVVKWPLFYAEILFYLSELKEDLKIFLTNNRNINFILDSISLYSKASQSCEEDDQNYLKEIRIGRSYLISFISEMIDEYGDLIMTKDKIIYPLLGQLFERNLRDYTLKILKKYFLISKNPTPILNGIATVINGIIAQELLNENDHYDQCIELLISLFEMLNEVSKLNENFNEIENVFKSVSSLQLRKKGNSIDFFYTYLDALYLHHMKYSVKPLIPFILKCIHIFYNEGEFDEKLYDSLVRFIQDDTIQSPEFLHIILNLFNHSPLFDKFMNLLNDLLKNKENRIICSNSGFDEYLIDLVTDDEDVKIQKNFLSAFKEIAKTKSSSSVVFKFISKLRPNDNSFLPNNEEILLEVLREMVLDYYFENTHMTYSCGKKYESSEKHQEFTKEKGKFTFYFWIFFHNKEKIEDEIEYTLINIEKTFSIVIQKGQLFLKTLENKYFIKGIETYWKWNLIAISSHKNYQKLSIHVNSQIPDQKLDFVNFDIDPSKVTIGDPRLHNNNDIEICNVSFMRHEKSIDVSKIYNEGPNRMIRAIRFHREKEEDKNERISKGNYNFVDYLLHSWEIDIILPLFALCDISYSNQSNFLNAFYYSMEIFVPSFLSLRNASSDIFLALSCILLTYSADKLTFSMYNRFFELFEFITDEELKDTLFVNVLSNDEIWSRNESEVEKIVVHWSKYLVDAFIKQFSFSYVLNYSYSYLNLPKEKFENCMKSIRSILIAISKDHFTKEDFDNLIIECIGTINESSFLTLQALVYEINDKLKSMKLKLIDFIQLNRIIIHKNQSLICLMIETIIVLHKQKVINQITLFEHLTLIMQDLPATAIHIEFFERIIGHLKVGVVELVPICAWFCFKENDLQASQKFTSVFCSIKSFKNEGLLIWPLILAFKSEDEIKSSIIYHIADVMTDKWKEILILIDLIFTAIKYDPKDLQFCFMDHLMTQISQIQEKVNLTEFVDYYLFLILYQRTNFSICEEMTKLLSDTFNQKSDTDNQKNSFYAFPSVLNSNIIKISKDESYDLNFVLYFRNDSKDNHFIDDLRLMKLFESLSIVHNGRVEMTTKSILSVLNHQHPTFVQKNSIQNNPLFLKTLNQLNYSDVLSEYKKIFKELSKKMSDSIKYTIFGFSTFSIDYHPYGDFQSIVPQRRKKNRMIWARLWSSLSISKGPWDSKMVTEYRGPSRWKRDQTICFAMSPMKMKKNFHFITHGGKSPENKPKPKTALALFADSSTDLISPSSSVIFDLDQLLDENNDGNHESRDSKLIASNLSPDDPSNDEIRLNPKKANKLAYVANCKVVKLTGQYDSKFLLFKDKIVIQVFNRKSISIPLNKIKYILRKSRFHRPTAIEMYTSERLSFFVDFLSEESWNSVIDNMVKIKVKCKNFMPKLSFSSYFQSLSYTAKWKERKISNFEYLMRLNILSGRSFNDLSQYPFLPWILKDYGSTFLDLKKDDIYRPLNRPIGTIEESTLSRIIERYHDLLDGFDAETRPNMFPSGPISPLSICLFLTRMEPFTTLHIQFQGGKFDMPDRLVTSIEQLFASIVKGNAESWELSPEFFFQAEFLTNDNQFDLGTINNERIDDIELPKWSHSPFDFIYKHRKALESDFVSEHLNEWIDLNFGYLQKNPEVYNLYDDKLYEDVWSHYQFSNEKVRKIVETSLSLVGQIPSQIFKEPHVKRKVSQIDYLSCQRKSKLHQIESPVNDTVSCVFFQNKNEILLLSISINYEVTTIAISIDNDKAKVVNKEDFSEILRKRGKNDEKIEIKKVGNGKFALVKEDSFLLYSTDKYTNYIFEIPYISCISSSHDWTIFSCRESILNIYQKNKRIASTHQYRDVITCCSLSNKYQMIVTGTKDGGLIVSTLNGINVRVIEIGNSPKKVMITPGWGFIVAYTEPLNLNESPEIIVHSLNGTFIKRLKLDAQIDEWVGWKSKSGFDFIAFNQGKKISYLEVYFLEKIFVARVSRQLIGFTYSVENDSFVFVEKDGIIEKLYYPIDDLNIIDNNVNK